MFKSLFTEFLTTFVFVLAISLAGVYGNPLVTALAVAGAFAMLVYVFGQFSGAHFNPAISLGAFVKGDISAKRFGLYVLVQILGAVAGFALILAIIQIPEYKQFLNLAVTKFPLTAGADTTYIGIPALLEFIFTFLLVFAVMSVALNKKKEGNQYYGIAISLVVFVGVFALFPFTGASMNPAVALGSNIVNALQDTSKYFADKQNINLLVVFLVPQLLAGLVAGLLGKVMVDGNKIVLKMPKKDEIKKEVSEEVEEIKEKVENVKEEVKEVLEK